jgi:hypothetical protein
MSILLETDFDLSRVTKYNKLKSDSDSFLKNKIPLLIESVHHPKLFQALGDLFDAHHIIEQEAAEILYIIGQHILLYEAMEQNILDSVECEEPLHFLHSYIEQLDIINRKSRTPEIAEKRINESYLQIVFPFSGKIAPAKLSNTHHLIKVIYASFKTDYPQALKELLAPYKELPNLEAISEIKNSNNRMLNYVSNNLIPELALDLLDYFETIIPKKLSRKRYYFIFELLYLSGIFYINERETVLDYKVTNKFKLLKIIETEKTGYIKTSIHRYKKYMKNH